MQFEVTLFGWESNCFHASLFTTGKNAIIYNLYRSFLSRKWFTVHSKYIFMNIAVGLAESQWLGHGTQFASELTRGLNLNLSHPNPKCVWPVWTFIFVPWDQPGFSPGPTQASEIPVLIQSFGLIPLLWFHSQDSQIGNWTTTTHLHFIFKHCYCLYSVKS